HDLDSVLSVTSRQKRVLGAEISISVAETRKTSHPTSKEQKENEYGYRNEHVETDGYVKRNEHVKRNEQVERDEHERSWRASLLANQRGKELYHPLPSVCERRACRSGTCRDRGRRFWAHQRHLPHRTAEPVRGDGQFPYQAASSLSICHQRRRQFRLQLRCR